MLSRGWWFLVAALCIVVAVWHAAQPVEVVYSRRTMSDGTIRVSAIMCGNGPSMVFAGVYDDDVLGPATQNDCLKAGRTRVAEVIGLGLVAAGFIYGGFRFGKGPPRPIRSELPDLPMGERGFHGRGRHRERSK